MIVNRLLDECCASRWARLPQGQRSKFSGEPSFVPCRRFRAFKRCVEVVGGLLGPCNTTCSAAPFPRNKTLRLCPSALSSMPGTFLDSTLGSALSVVRDPLCRPHRRLSRSVLYSLFVEPVSDTICVSPFPGCISYLFCVIAIYYFIRLIGLIVDMRVIKCEPCNTCTAPPCPALKE